MLDWRPHRIMMPGRVATLLLLLAALLQPASVRHDKPTIAVLVDHSGSMAPTAIVDARQRLAHDLDVHVDRVELNAMRFSETSIDESLDRALREALLGMRPNPGNSIVIASHGYWSPSSEAVLERLSKAHLPVYWLPTDAVRNEARIAAVAAPSVAGSGQRIGVSVTTVIPDGIDYDVVLFGNRSPAGRTRARSEAPAIFEVIVPDSGSLSLSAELVRNDDGSVVARLDNTAIVNVIAPPNLLLVSSDPSPFGDSLAAGGWPVTRVSPSGLPALTGELDRFDALILDDVAATAAPSWAAVAEAVRRNAMGLIVIGGPDSYALGGYRGSSLEELLPVISEPPEAERPASVEFLVDISGSMGSGTANTLRIAQVAVLETADALRPVDQVGLVAFDVSARQLLPLASRDDHRDAIRQVWPNRASGGTNLGPALQQGLGALERAPGEQKILMLVTDGMLKDEDVAILDQELENNDIEFVAMVIDPDHAAGSLARIASHERATILVVDNVLRLPEMMRSELEAQREAIVRERTVPLVRAPVSFVDIDEWPALDAYVVVRPKQGASVLLGSPGGDVLLATWNAGAGRVIALPGGLAEWAGDWLSWDRWPEFAAGMASYVAVRNAHQPQLSMNSGTLEFDAENDVPRNVRLVRPSSDDETLEPELVAPRRYRLDTPRSQPGIYSLTWESGTTVHRHSFVRRAKTQATAIGEPVARSFVEKGILREWTTADALLPRTSRKTVLLLLALAVFVSTVTLERVPLQKR